MRNFIYKSLNLFSPVFESVSKNRLRVLAYHDIVDPVVFEAQIKWLQFNYHIIDINTLKHHLFKKEALPPKSLLITLDDGDLTVFKKALPIFKKYKIPTCLFIVTDLINSHKDFWWDTIIKNENKNGLSKAEIMEIINYNKSVPNEERIKFLSKYPPTRKRQLTTDEIRELEENRVYIANHSHTHPMFNKLDKKDIIKELEQSKDFFYKNNIGDFKIFAYPNGNYNLQTERLLETNNIEMAFLFDHKLNKEYINPLRISRIAVDSNTPLPEFRTKVSGLHPFILSVKK